MYDKLIINLTPTGMLPMKANTPHVPVTTDEIVQDVRRCASLGASVVHLHARDSEELPTSRKEVFAEIIDGIRETCPDLILCVTTSGRSSPDIKDRAEVLSLDGDRKPDMASLTLGSLNFPNQASVNSPEIIRGLLGKMHESEIKPELEVFDLGMINYANYLIRKGMLRPPHYFNLLVGNIATAQDDLLTLGQMIRELPEDSVWSLAGIGRCRNRITALSVAFGGHVRIGLEDDIYFDEERKILATNEMLVRRVVEVARAVGRDIATTSEAREMLGLVRG